MKFLRDFFVSFSQKTGLEPLKERVLSAIQTMKAAADHVANTVDDDGNYQALKYLIVI